MEHLVTFTPENRYFFGYTHSYDDSYIIKSRQVPPLSTILGTIRKAILDQNKILEISFNSGHFIEEENNSAHSIIDATGDFDYNTKPGGNLGWIKSISPVFLVRKSDNKLFYPIPLKWQKEGDNIVSRAIVKKDDVYNNFNGSMCNSFVYMENYNAKSGIREIWVNMDIWKNFATLKATTLASNADILFPEQIFVSNIHPGINRGIKQDKNGRKSVIQSSDEQNFFMKEDYSIKDNAFCFGVIIDFDDNQGTLQNSGVFMGGDRSFFFMEVENNFQINNEDTFIAQLLMPRETLEQGKVYIVLSETNMVNLADGKLTSLNKGHLELQRRMVLPRNSLSNSSPALPFRLKKKGAVQRSLPVGSIIFINEVIKLTQVYNPSVGFDRYYLLEGD